MSPYDSPEWGAFVDAIRERPKDDAPRLVAADWIEENGDHGRAEFIRFHVRYARVRHNHRAGGPPCPACPLKRQIQPLFDRTDPTTWLPVRHVHLCESEWCRSYFREQDTADGMRGLVTRGFVSDIAIAGDDWFARADRLLAAHPLCRVQLTTGPTEEAVARYRWKSAGGYGVGRTLDMAMADEWPDLRFCVPPTFVEILGMAALSNLIRDATVGVPTALPPGALLTGGPQEVSLSGE